MHISSGTASLAIALYLGKRRGYGTQQLAYKPHNTFFVVLGTAFLWFGWFGFNGGSGLGAKYVFVTERYCYKRLTVHFCSV